MNDFLGVRLNLETPPKDLGHAMQAAADALVERMMAEDLPHLVFTTFGKRPMRFELAKAPPGVDDLLRAICQHEHAFAAILVFPCPPPPGVDAPRALMIRGEDSMHRAEWVLGFRGQGKKRECRFYQSPMKLVDPTWIGVEPEGCSVFEMEGNVGYFGATIEA